VLLAVKREGIHDRSGIDTPPLAPDAGGRCVHASC
jgi:hypothetical protein